MPEYTRADIEKALERLVYVGRGGRPNYFRDSLIHDSPDDECWPWRGSSYAGGYGRAHVPMENRSTSAHRVVWVLLNGPVADDVQIDHTCHDPAECNLGPRCPHRMCVNPNHLKAVTGRANWARSNSPSSVNQQKTHCKHGHEFTSENTYVNGPKGYRSCVTCTRKRNRLYEPHRPPRKR